MDITVMLADEHTLVRKGIRALLETDDAVKVVEEAEDGAECIEKLVSMKEKNSLPGLLISDLFLPGKSGVQVLREVRDFMPEIKVLFLSACGEPGCLSEAIRAGTDGYLLKNAGFHELRTAIYTIAEGKKYIQPVLQERLKNGYQSKLEMLTDREKEILIQTADGKLNKEIADHFKISERTVKNHLSSIFRKIEVSDRTQAAVYAIRNHLGELREQEMSGDN